MQITFTRIAIPLIGIAFGFFIGCSTLSSSSQKTVQPDELSKQELREELSSADKKIQAGQADADLYYHKGYLLTQYAQKLDDPAERTSSYQELQVTLKKSAELFEDANLPSGNQKVDELLKVTWSGEHNLGVEIMQSDSTLENEDYKKAAIHFKNATKILPDTAISYKMEARAYYRNGQNMKALSTLEEAKNQIENLPPEMLEQLAFLYLETKQPTKAVKIYEEAESAFSSNNLNIIHGLANAYISSGEHKQAINLLENLVRSEPDNIIYAQALATEYYHLGSSSLSKITDGVAASEDEEELIAEADSLFTHARTLLENSVSSNTGNQELQKALVQFYQNAAAKYQNVLPELSDNRKAELKETIHDYLSSSIPVYEKLAQQNPETKDYWKNLYRVYSYLGMSEKAEEAKSNIN